MSVMALGGYRVGGVAARVALVGERAMIAWERK